MDAMDEAGLLKLSLAKLKKRCKSFKVSSEGSKRDLIQRLSHMVDSNTVKPAVIPKSVYKSTFFEPLNEFDIRMYYIISQWFRANPPDQIGGAEAFIFSPKFFKLITSNILSTDKYDDFVEKIFKLKRKAKEETSVIKGVEFEYSGDSRTEEEATVIEWTLQIYFNKKNECFYKYYRSDWDKWDGAETVNYKGRGTWKVTDYETLCISVKQKEGKTTDKTEEIIEERLMLDDLEHILDEKYNDPRLKFAGDGIVGKYIYK